MKAIDEIKAKLPKADNGDGDDGYNILEDPKYVRNSMSLIIDSLEKGNDIMQLENGDVLVTEIKTVTMRYEWDSKKGKMIRSSLNRSKRNKKDTLSDENAPKHTKILEDELA